MQFEDQKNRTRNAQGSYKKVVADIVLARENRPS
jgi:hypothetical protein